MNRLLLLIATIYAPALLAAEQQALEIAAVVEQHALDYAFQLEPVELALSDELAVAKEQYDAGRWQATIANATTFLEEHPDHTQATAAYFLRGESYAQLGEYGQSRRDFRRLLKQKPTPVQRRRAEFRIAEAAMLEENYDEAQHLFERFRDRHSGDPLNAYALVYLGELVGRENPVRAKALFVESLQRYPGGPLHRRARLHLALVQLTEGSLEQAYKGFKELTETGVRTDADYWLAWYWQGHVEMRLAKTAEAMERLKIFVQDQPVHPYAAAAYLEIAEASFAEGNYHDALEAYEQLSQSEQGEEYHAESILGRMRVWKALGYHDRALAAFRKIPKDAGGAIRVQGAQLVAEILIDQKQFARAESLIAPYVRSSRASTADVGQVNHFVSLFLQALALRGQQKYRVASELLGRIRHEVLPEDVAQKVRLARIETWVVMGDYDDAIRHALRFEVDYPAGELLSPVRVQLIRGLVATKRYEEAKLKLRQLQETDESRDYIALASEWVAEDAYARGDWALARASFDLLQQTHTHAASLARALTGLAWIAKKQERYAEASDWFARFVEEFPEHADVWKIRLSYADVLLELNERAEALRVLSSFRDLPVAHPDRARGLYQYVVLAKQDAGMDQRSKEMLDELLEEYPDFELRDGALYLAGMLHRGNAAGTAEDHFLEIVKEHPTSRYWSDAMYRLAELARNQEQSGRAKSYLTRLVAAKSDPEVLPHALLLRGRIESEEKNWTEAREVLRDLLRDYPETELRHVARYGIAESFFQEKDFGRAGQLFDILDQEKPFDDGDSWAAMVRFRKAQLAVQQKDLARATEIAGGIQSQFPDFPLQHEVDYLLGRVAAAQGEFSTAREAYQRVVEADPAFEREMSAMAQWMTGETHYHQKQFVLAIKAYEAVLADWSPFDNWQAASLLQIGKSYEMLDNLAQARTAYSRVIERYPDEKWVKEAKHRLKQIGSGE